jgi:hypothetical protein
VKRVSRQLHQKLLLAVLYSLEKDYSKGFSCPDGCKGFRDAEFLIGDGLTASVLQAYLDGLKDGVGDLNLPESDIKRQGATNKKRLLIPHPKTRQSILAYCGDRAALATIKRAGGMPPSKEAVVDFAKEHAKFMTPLLELDLPALGPLAKFLRSVVRPSPIYLGVVREPAIVGPLLRTICDRAATASDLMILSGRLFLDCAKYAFICYI